MRSATIALQRIARGRQEKSQMLLGLRGVGKTVLLNRIAQIAEDMGAIVVTLEAPEGQRLAAFLAPALKAVLLRLSRVEQARDLAQRALAALRGFASAFTVSIGEIDVAIAPETLADSGNLEVDLPWRSGRAIPIFCRSGESIPGTSPLNRQSRSRMWSRRAGWLQRHWIGASSVSALIGSPHGSRSTFVPWPHWDRGRIDPVISPRSWGSGCKPPARCAAA